MERFENLKNASQNFFVKFGVRLWGLVTNAKDLTNILIQILNLYGVEVRNKNLRDIITEQASNDHPAFIAIEIFLLLFEIQEIKERQVIKPKSEKTSLIPSVLGVNLEETLFTNTDKPIEDLKTQLNEQIQSLLAKLNITDLKLDATAMILIMEDSWKAYGAALTCLHKSPFADKFSPSFPTCNDDLAIPISLLAPALFDDEESLEKFRATCQTLTQMNSENFALTQKDINKIQTNEWKEILSHMSTSTMIKTHLRQKSDKTPPLLEDFLIHYIENTTPDERTPSKENIGAIQETAKFLFGNTLKYTSFQHIIQSTNPQLFAEKVTGITEIIVFNEDHAYEHPEHTNAIIDIINKQLDSSEEKVHTYIANTLLAITPLLDEYTTSFKKAIKNLPNSMQKNYLSELQEHVLEIVNFHTSLFKTYSDPVAPQSILDVYRTLCECKYSGPIEAVFGSISQVLFAAQKTEMANTTEDKSSTEPSSDTKYSWLRGNYSFLIQQKDSKNGDYKQLDALSGPHRKKCRKDITQAHFQNKCDNPLIHSLLKLTNNPENFSPHHRKALKYFHAALKNPPTSKQEYNAQKKQVLKSIEKHHYPFSSADIILTGLRVALTETDIGKAISDTVTITRTQASKRKTPNNTLESIISKLVDPDHYDYKEQAFRPKLREALQPAMAPKTQEASAINYKMIYPLIASVFLTLLTGNWLALSTTTLSFTQSFLYALGLTSLITSVIGAALYWGYQKSELNMHINGIQSLIPAPSKSFNTFNRTSHFATTLSCASNTEPSMKIKY